MELIDALRICVTREDEGTVGLMTRAAGGEGVIRECLCGVVRVVCKGVALIAVRRIREAEGGDGVVLNVMSDLGGECEERVIA